MRAHGIGRAVPPAGGARLPFPAVTDASATAIVSRTGEVDGQPVFWREAPGSGAPVLYVHGVPTSSHDWLPFLERTGGLAPDLPGFGRSSKRGDLGFSIPFYGAWIEAFLAAAGADAVRLVVHDWGAAALAFAQRHPGRIERLVIINAVPLLPGYRWHRIARVWRTRFAGEFAMGLVSRRTLRWWSREANAAPGPLPDALVREAAGHFDQGTQRAILRLYRSSPPDVLAAAGQDLGAITAPALVVWGEQDPYIPARFGPAYAAALGGEAAVELVPDAGHWPWLDRPGVVDTVAAFLEGR
jgi:pimeloyl-ACP methyl ester carboxylesterase